MGEGEREREREREGWMRSNLVRTSRLRPPNYKKLRRSVHHRAATLLTNEVTSDPNTLCDWPSA